MVTQTLPKPEVAGFDQEGCNFVASIKEAIRLAREHKGCLFAVDGGAPGRIYQAHWSQELRHVCAAQFIGGVLVKETLW